MFCLLFGQCPKRKGGIFTRSLLSAIPAPNPIVEKKRKSLTYNYHTSGIDYNKGSMQHVDGTHYVRCTMEEFENWTRPRTARHS